MTAFHGTFLTLGHKALYNGMTAYIYPYGWDPFGIEPLTLAVLISHSEHQALQPLSYTRPDGV